MSALPVQSVRVLDLFAGIGGFSLGLERAGMQTVAFCEADEWCRDLLLRRWPGVPIHKDVRELDASEYRGAVQLVCGGFPCQPFSIAGKRAGKKDERHLWPEMARVIGECRPRWVIGENVPGLINLALDEVLFDLDRLGYSAETICIPAAGVDAPHRRERLWIVAHDRNADGDSKPACAIDAKASELPSNSGTRRAGALAHADRQGLAVGERIGRMDQSAGRGPEGQVAANGDQAVGNAGEHGQPEPARREPQPGMGRVADGLSLWLDRPARWPDEPGITRVTDEREHCVARLRALGNAVVPQVVEALGRMIIEVDRCAT